MIKYNSTQQGTEIENIEAKVTHVDFRYVNQFCAPKKHHENGRNYVFSF